MPDPLDELIRQNRAPHERACHWLKRNFARAALLSAVVWLVTLPLVLSQFHIASPIAVLVSPIVSLIVFVTMWSGFLMLVIGPIIAPLGMALGTVCNWSIGWLEGVVNWADRVPAGHFWAPGPSWWWVAVFYVALLFVMVRGKPLFAPRWQAAALAIWILIGLVPPMVRHLGRATASSVHS